MRRSTRRRWRRSTRRPEAVRYLNDGVPYTREETERQSERFSCHWAVHDFGLWAATVNATERTIGFVGVAHPRWFPDLAHEVEIGWRLHPDAWGHGYATEAGHAALDAARAELALTRVIAVIDPANTPSIAVATRLGMVREHRVPHPHAPVTWTSTSARAPWGEARTPTGQRPALASSLRGTPRLDPEGSGR